MLLTIDVPPAILAKRGILLAWDRPFNAFVMRKNIVSLTRDVTVGHQVLHLPAYVNVD